MTKTTTTKPTTKELMKLRQTTKSELRTLEPNKEMNDKDFDRLMKEDKELMKKENLTKKIELTKTDKPIKEKSLTTIISYSQKFSTRTIWTDNGQLHFDFTRTGEKSRGTKLIYNKIKWRLQLGKTKNEDIGTTTKELKTFIQEKKIYTEHIGKIIDTMEKNIDKINDLLDNEEKGNFTI